MYKKLHFACLLGLFIVFGCTSNEIKQQVPQSISIQIKSENPTLVKDNPVKIPIKLLMEKARNFNPYACIVLVQNQEPNGIQTQKEFNNYLQKTVTELSKPTVIVN